jgi:hypothetical protein
MPISSFTPQDKNPWYDPSVGLPGVSWQNDPLNTGFQYGEQNPAASWLKRLSDLGMGGTSAKSQFAQGLYSQAQRGYQAENVNAPGLYWQDYLTQKINPDTINEQWLGQSPGMRGIDTSLYAPNARRLRRA